MKKKFLQTVSIFLSMGAIAATSLNNFAEATCRTTEVNLESLPNESSNQAKESTQRAKLFLRCMGGTPVIPGTTLLQTVREQNGKLCYSDMACGNVSSFSGYVALSGTWIFYKSVLEFLTSHEGQQAVIAAKREYEGQNSGIRVGLEWGQITRHCKPISTEMCL
jgi:hypothetical protein